MKEFIVIGWHALSALKLMQLLEVPIVVVSLPMASPQVPQKLVLEDWGPSRLMWTAFGGLLWVGKPLLAVGALDAACCNLIRK